MKRRDFLKTGAAGAAIVFVPGMGFFNCTKNVIQPTIDPISINFCSPVNIPEERGGFYTLFIRGRDYVPDDLNLDTWRLKLKQTVGGNIYQDKEVSLTFDQIVNQYPEDEEVSFFHTLQCVGNLPDGYQISNGYFTGHPLHRYLDDVLGVDWGQANRVYFRCYDDFHTNHTKELVRSTSPDRAFLIYKFDGIRFDDPRRGSLQHGYPVRVLVPEMLGMKSPKALVEIEVSDRDEIDGHWETRPVNSEFPNITWSDRPLMKANSRIFDPVNFQMMRPGSTYKIRGIAFGGIDPQSGNPAALDKMEIGIAEAPNRIEFGKRTYHEATIQPRPTGMAIPDYDDSDGTDFNKALDRLNNNVWPTPFVWSLWELDLKVPSGKGMYRLFARATDTQGNKQPLEETQPADIADGNNGQHSIIIQVD